jgi:hypothetical protein
MDQGSSFEVIIRRKVPYLTSFLFNLLMVFMIALLIIDLFFLPTQHASLEMKVAWYILVVPDLVKNALIVSVAGLVVVYPIYRAARYHRDVLLTFLVDHIGLKGKKMNTDIPVNGLRRIYCMDSKTLSGIPKEKLTIYFQEKNGNTIRVRLRHYVQADEFMECLMRYKSVEFKTYDFDVSPDLENEA